jgi:hypothetical protein
MYIHACPILFQGFANIVAPDESRFCRIAVGEAGHFFGGPPEKREKSEGKAEHLDASLFLLSEKIGSCDIFISS